MSGWEIPESVAGDLIKFDFLPPPVEFRPAGSVGGIPLFEHTCARPGPSRGVAYVSAMPSADDDEYVVPFCGCRPAYRTRTGKLLTEAEITALADEAERGYDVTGQLKRKAALDAAGVPYLIYEFKPDDPA